MLTSCFEAAYRLSVRNTGISSQPEQYVNPDYDRWVKSLLVSANCSKDEFREVIQDAVGDFLLPPNYTKEQHQRWTETYLQDLAEEVNRENSFDSDPQSRWIYLLASLKCNRGEIMRIREQSIQHRLPQYSAIIGRYELIEDLSRWYCVSNSQLEQESAAYGGLSAYIDVNELPEADTKPEKTHIHEPSIKNQGHFANMYSLLPENAAYNGWAIFPCGDRLDLKGPGEIGDRFQYQGGMACTDVTTDLSRSSGVDDTPKYEEAKPRLIWFYFHVGLKVWRISASSRRTRRNGVVAHKEDSPISEAAAETPLFVSVSPNLPTPKDIEHNRGFAVLINVFLTLGFFFALFGLIFSSAEFIGHYQSIMQKRRGPKPRIQRVNWTCVIPCKKSPPFWRVLLTIGRLVGNGSLKITGVCLNASSMKFKIL